VKPAQVLRAVPLVLLLVLAVPAAGADGRYELGLEAWAGVGEGGDVAALPELRAVVTAWGERPGAALRIAYAGGEQGELRALELRGWLITLGVPGAAIEAVPAAVDPTVLELRVLP
jgi:hypothetical protein